MYGVAIAVAVFLANLAVALWRMGQASEREREKAWGLWRRGDR